MSIQLLKSATTPEERLIDAIIDGNASTVRDLLVAGADPLATQRWVFNDSGSQVSSYQTGNALDALLFTAYGAVVFNAARLTDLRKIATEFVALGVKPTNAYALRKILSRTVAGYGAEGSMMALLVKEVDRAQGPAHWGKADYKALFYPSPKLLESLHQGPAFIATQLPNVPPQAPLVKQRDDECEFSNFVLNAAANLDLPRIKQLIANGVDPQARTLFHFNNPRTRSNELLRGNALDYTILKGEDAAIFNKFDLPANALLQVVDVLLDAGVRLSNDRARHACATWLPRSLSGDYHDRLEKALTLAATPIPTPTPELARFPPIQALRRRFGR